MKFTMNSLLINTLVNNLVAVKNTHCDKESLIGHLRAGSLVTDQSHEYTIEVLEALVCINPDPREFVIAFTCCLWANTDNADSVSRIRAAVNEIEAWEAMMPNPMTTAFRQVAKKLQALVGNHGQMSAVYLDFMHSRISFSRNTAMEATMARHFNEVNDDDYKFLVELIDDVTAPWYPEEIPVAK